MNIKYISNVRIPTPRAQGYAILKMCSEFSNLGIKVDLFVPSRKNTENNKNPFDFYKIEKNFEINKVSSFDFLGKTLKFGRIFYWIDILSFLVASKFKVRVNKGDILYTRDYLALLFFSKRKFICLELHDIPDSDFIFKKVIKKPKLFFVLNNNFKKVLVSMGVEESKIYIAPSGVEIKDFDINISNKEAREKTNLPLNKKIVLYSGQLYPWKGADILAEAAKMLPEINFVFVGGTGPEFSIFKSNYKNVKNIFIVPFVERSKIPYYLKSADVLVVPNSAKGKISTHFTSPLKLFEYMASKRPVVISDLPSMREAISEKSCIFVKPDDPLKLAEGIKRLLNDQSLSDKVSDSGYSEVQSHSWNNRVKNILLVINNNINNE